MAVLDILLFIITGLVMLVALLAALPTLLRHGIVVLAVLAALFDDAMDILAGGPLPAFMDVVVLVLLLLAFRTPAAFIVLLDLLAQPFPFASLALLASTRTRKR